MYSTTDSCGFTLSHCENTSMSLSIASTDSTWEVGCIDRKKGTNQPTFCFVLYDFSHLSDIIIRFEFLFIGDYFNLVVAKGGFISYNSRPSLAMALSGHAIIAYFNSTHVGPHLLVCNDQKCNHPTDTYMFDVTRIISRLLSIRKAILFLSTLKTGITTSRWPSAKI